MRRFGRQFALGVIVLASSAGSVRAQYPAGYGGYGWGGWGGYGGGGQTVQGDIARGLGAFAASAGQYNVQTAQARSINADTAMRWNQYVWESQQEANKRHYKRMVRAQDENSKAHEAIYKRLHDTPEPGDITRGDALNVALDEISNPRVYLRKLSGASTKIPGAIVRDIPFQLASAAVTTSVEQLTKGGPPAALRTEAFAKERTELKALAAELRKQVEDDGKPDPASLKKVRDIINVARNKLVGSTPKGKPREDAEKFLKALYGLTKMLETPATEVLLSGIEKHPETTLGALIGFMESYNLRFGAATTPKQQAAYRQLYPLLDSLRDEAAASLSETQTATALKDEDERPGEFFSGMQFEDMDAGKGVPTPPKPQGR
ncbi:hypothetical protein [Singulisphaera sp. PoT]|uniref:hypothetical protein n=1 Tax=Singulisphaera sp. PoT TaxID=3411797 RepID=UPI003BF5B81C